MLDSTYRREGLATRGSGCENDVRIIILIHTEKALERWVVTKAARDLEATSKSALITAGG